MIATGFFPGTLASGDTTFSGPAPSDPVDTSCLPREARMGKQKPDMIKGTLDMLILKVLSLEPMHGWGIGERIQQSCS